MGSGRDRDDPLSFTSNPSTASSPVTVSDYLDTFLGEPTSRSGSFQSESLLGVGGGERASTTLISDSLVLISDRSNSLELYSFTRGMFSFATKIPLFGLLGSRLLSSIDCLGYSLPARKGKKETRLTICEGHDGTETSSGDV
ncbi:PREDICTED: uncharacterized protein LOC104737429 [Camelina sativa]|uniref:Uncharacterized protein LOC104737429 n=1 Tax=Camelina sativa TaxID=90675 RepID=A0ABM0VGQ8_CAMSA|nr:PREDICTED: uncharacterized protein LOC104737429 [Camelina sativa]